MLQPYQAPQGQSTPPPLISMGPDDFLRLVRGLLVLVLGSAVVLVTLLYLLGGIDPGELLQAIKDVAIAGLR